MSLPPKQHNLMQRGYVLLPVVVAIALIAAIAFLTSRESAMNMNMAASDHGSTRAEYVAQAGLNHALWQAKQQGCGPYTDLTSQVLSSDSYTTTLTTGQGSTTDFIISVDQDTWIRSDNITFGQASGTELHLKFDGGTIERPLYRYDLSSISTGSTILSARAWFYVTKEHPNGPVDIHRLTGDWTEAGATWETMGDKIESTVQASIPSQPVKDVWVSVNLTAQVQAWVNGQPNYGVALNTTTEGALFDYSSREHAEQPYMEVVVGTLPSSPATLTSVGTLADGTSHSITRDDVILYQKPPGIVELQPGAEGTDAEIWEQAPDNNYGDADETWVSSASNDTTRTLLRFDMDAVPAGARIVGATLTLRRRSGSGADQPVSAHRIMNSWSEDSVTWNRRKTGTDWDTAGVDFDNMAVATTPVGPVNQRYEWNITPLAQGWVDGSYPNYGVVLVGAIAGMPGERFDTSDHTDPSRWPSLSITYTCSCGETCIAPQGSGKVAMVVNYSGISISAEDQVKKDTLESWGYDVDTFDDSTIGWPLIGLLNYIDNYDVVYISETADSNAVGTQLTSQSIGIVNEQGDLNDELEIAGGMAHTTGISVNIVDNSHYITNPFPGGDLSIYGRPMELAMVTNPLATGLSTLADISGAGSLVALDKGLQTTSGGPAAGRRVTLPLGTTTTSKFNWDYLNNNGRLMVQRAIEWAKPFTCNDGEYRDNFENVAFNNNDGSLTWTGNWIEVDGDGAGANDGNVWITSGQLRLDDSPDTGGYPSAARKFNLDGATNATLTFDFELDSGTEVGEDIAVLEISTDGSNWTQLEDFSQWDGGDSGSGEFDLSAYLTADTQIRFRVSDNYGGSNEYLAIDNLTVSVCGTVADSLAPLAHWKLDESSGITAVDSIGGHDGTLTNGPTWTTGHLGGALDFDDNNDTVVIPDDPFWSLDPAMLRTWVAWIKPDDLSSEWSSVFAQTNASARGFGIIAHTTSNSNMGPVTNGISIGWDESDAHKVGLHSTNNVLTEGAWHHVVVTHNGALAQTDRFTIYVNGVDVTDRSDVSSNGILNGMDTTSIAFGGNPVDSGSWFGGGIDDVRVYDRVLGASEIAALSAEGGGGGGGSSSYVEAYQEWTASQSGQWQVKDFSSYGVPANAVVEVAVVNNNTNAERWGGVRKVGSLLDRHLQLHEPEGGGEDAVVMHVQADGNSQIEHYADDTGDVFFSVMGYWTGGVYEERFDSFSAGGSGSWRDRDLSAFGVSAGQVAEIVMANTRTNKEREAGVRTNGSGLSRILDIHEAEDGGVDTATMLVTADNTANATIQVYAESNIDVDFYLTGYWTTPPGTFTESAGTELNPSSENETWTDWDLSSGSVPANAIVYLGLLNCQSNDPNSTGARPVGSAEDRRWIRLQEAENGGCDTASWHVAADSNSTIQWYDENTEDDHRFHVLGWWELN